MTRWDPGNRNQILQSIADDERRPPHEREAARRELAAIDRLTPPTPRRHGRNANVPQTQADQDTDIESWYQRVLLDNDLTGSDRREIRQGFDTSTHAILDAFGSGLLWLFENNAAEIQLLIDLHRRTQSDFVRAKATKTIRWIADYSPLESAKTEAQQCLDQLNQTIQPTPKHED